MVSFRKILSFRRPVIHRVEYIDIVIEDKVLLALEWDFKNKYSVSIPTIRKTYHSSSGAVIVKIPSHKEAVLVVIRNGWRRETFRIQLAKLKLDKTTASMLIRQFKPFDMPELQVRKPVVGGNIAGTELPPISYKRSSLYLSSNTISFKKRSISINNKTCYDEKRFL